MVSIYEYKNNEKREGTGINGGKSFHQLFVTLENLL
jgi:hypothetical protein